MLLLLPAVGGCGRSPQRLKSGQCKPGDPLAGVYLPSRLAVHNACTTVAGTVDCVQAEPDGDIHLRLRPDPAYRRLLTAANAFQQCPQQKDPHLVVEIIPQVGHGAFEDNSATKAGLLTPTAPPRTITSPSPAPTYGTATCSTTWAFIGVQPGRSRSGIRDLAALFAAVMLGSARWVTPSRVPLMPRTFRWRR